MTAVTIYNNRILDVSEVLNDYELIKWINDELDQYFDRSMTEDEHEQLLGDNEGDGQFSVKHGLDNYTFTYIINTDDIYDPTTGRHFRPSKVG